MDAEKEARNAAAGQRRRRTRFALYHANARGNGGAIKFELLPATAESEGCIMAHVACQSSVGDLRGPSPVYPRFDWEGAICVKLDFGDLTHILRVFRGECESLGGGGGLYHRTAKGATKISLRHILEPVDGYMFEVSRGGAGGQGDAVSARVFLPPNEALGIAAVIESSLVHVCFGMPDAAVRAPLAANAASEVRDAAVA